MKNTEDEQSPKAVIGYRLCRYLVALKNKVFAGFAFRAVGESLRMLQPVVWPLLSYQFGKEKSAIILARCFNAAGNRDIYYFPPSPAWLGRPRFANNPRGYTLYPV